MQSKKSYTTHIKKKDYVNGGHLKPDIAAYNLQRTIIIDIQVVNDQSDLESAHASKVSKYLPLEEILQILRKRD